ncbi:MAG: D-cysteine desulfhydrase family protein [Dehalococcoidales bacterium]
MIPSIAKLPRLSLGNYPTPLTDAYRLSAALGGPRIIIKRDDLTGLALGGNKCRKLEFIMADAREKGIDTVITTGSSQSNFALQLAAAARKLEIEPYLVLIKGAHAEMQGNLLLHNILDSSVRIIEAKPSELLGGTIMAKMNTLADELSRQGRKPLVIPAGAHTPLGTVGWMDAVDEIWQQLQSQNIDAQFLVVTNGSSGTQAGLELGTKYLGLPLKVIGFSVFHKSARAINEVMNMANETARFLNLDLTINADEITVYDDYIGDGYGIITDGCTQAIRLTARTEGIFLDPVYTGKAMAGFVDFIHKGRFTSTDAVVFIHSGGIPALFAYDKEIAG